MIGCLCHSSTHRCFPSPSVGDHGYDNSLPSMHPFLAAAGPGFRQGFQMSSMESVDVYPLMCRLLSVPPRPNNGTLSRAAPLLQTTDGWSVLLVVGLVVGVLLSLSVVTGQSEGGTG